MRCDAAALLYRIMSLIVRETTVSICVYVRVFKYENGFGCCVAVKAFFCHQLV